MVVVKLFYYYKFNNIGVTSRRIIVPKHVGAN
jgi:hypothetical protein